MSPFWIARIRSATDTGSRPNSNGWRVPLDEVGRLAWLERKARDGGFAVLSVTQTQNVSGSRASGRRTSAIVRFNGELQVVDVDRFRDTQMLGTGPAKPNGMGLLIGATEASFP